MEWEVITNSETFIMTIRLIIAAALGGLVGVEREFHQHPAGFRTHLLVSVGSCLIMLLAFYGFQNYISGHNPETINFDPSRLAAYVVSGIGFLGAGTILVQGYTVRGLTTAASIWVVAGIGLTVGAGMYLPAIITTIIVILSLFLLGKIDFGFLMKRKKRFIYLVVEEGKSPLSNLIKVVESYSIEVKGIKTEKQKLFNDKSMIEYRLYVEYEDKEAIIYLADHLNKDEFVHQVYLDGK
ncbi:MULTISPECIES: MgtC/SapB family protein [Bacillaceae]|uniref:MgtC/SapB family protein n=1 Tax=Evansella alkalicola TaxID=745819 RepID=A0ABS6JP48_9BACI|nr:MULTISPECIES: MgtC/SapB family protein [Bacillaceae]MBU9720258.1 MgtC/SapB family protein [Bacillus alkalicola]